ncbi:RING finger and CHY zinc finger domain-containing protein [Aspergillus clavatus NRRL 1]|uniref:CHY zinc finger domain protein n=1 Tax=Aspergillus clavatus (strain ATCC 1007 / CBS 513.65 / DSM 816 / NCTC 3887 / NRRL 1 / QM 1276 / 107) TaxID=344612 RepID=A1CQL9_ASPCL|nr:CHY zinc finger domain protein [Aspergillus clavatus NRRL 1]EAW07940.1 CHY zinc finger domain protein [Aspergillus clavatus NRRL 1]
MSGRISSLLIEPVVRQACRLSQQLDSHPPYDDDLGDSQTSIRDRSSLIGPNSTDLAVINNGLESERAVLHPSKGQAELDHTAPFTQPEQSLHESSGRHDDYGESFFAIQPTTGIPIASSSNQPVLTGPMHDDGNYSDPAVVGIAAGVNSIPAQNLVQETNRSVQGTNLSPASGNDTDIIGAQYLLPEDDGMGVLRRKIHAIRDLESTNDAKARMIHELMTERYHASREKKEDTTPSPPRPASPSSSWAFERPITPRSHQSSPSLDREPVTPVSTASIRQPRTEISHNLTAEDLMPTFFPRPVPDSPAGDREDGDIEDVEEPCLGCRHYKRNVKLQCFACKKWYTCRFCHDEAEDHHLNRPKTENMLCMLCGHPQPAAQVCRQCGEHAAQYYCDICKLWDNDSNKSIYHCNDCGICRIGQGLGKDFFHCKTCSVCLPISIENTHRCIERSTQCDCPICGDYMFTSPETVVFMRCGHSIHQKCLSEYSKSSYRCPICSKTIANMESTFRNLDRTIQSQPMPAEFKDTHALIHCNDCGAKSVVKYHWLGLKCDMCESYNTAQVQLLHSDALDALEQENEENRNDLTSRLRSSSHGAENIAPSLSSIQSRIDTETLSGANLSPRFRAASSTEPTARFSSYSLTRGRAVSPVISNYFGLPPDRETDRSRSTTSFFGGLTSKAGDDHSGGELSLWGTRIRYKYGFLDRDTESVDGVSDAQEDDVDDDDDDNSTEDAERPGGEDDDDDDDESIDIFGHR